MATVKPGDKVSWQYAGNTAHGTVQAVSPKKTTKTIKGKKITRNGTPDDPAVTVKSDRGGVALHDAHELKKG
jgi:plastocyanin